VSKLRHVWVRETNASEPLMRPRNRSTDGIKTGAPPLSGKSMAETWLLAMRCPGYRWRDPSLGSGTELENLLGGDNAGAAFFPGTSELWLIGAYPDRKIRIEPHALGGDVVAMGALNGRSVPVAVCRGRRVWLVTLDVTSRDVTNSDVTSSAVTRETPAPGSIADQGCTGALLWLDGDFLLATARELIVQTAAGDERHLPLAGGVDGAQPELHRAGERCVQVEAAGRSPLLLLITGDSHQLYQLPAVETRP
jgi:hypothetical protein